MIAETNKTCIIKRARSWFRFCADGLVTILLQSPVLAAGILFQEVSNGL
jgi:hypothetical protein